jgi:hypothetical protein
MKTKFTIAEFTALSNQLELKKTFIIGNKKLDRINHALCSHIMEIISIYISQAKMETK